MGQRNLADMDFGGADDDELVNQVKLGWIRVVVAHEELTFLAFDERVHGGRTWNTNGAVVSSAISARPICSKALRLFVA
jgi:hypothetical protein